MFDRCSGLMNVLGVNRLARDPYNLGASLESLRQTTTRAELQNLHDRLVHSYNQMSVTDRARAHQENYGDYPQPALPGNSHIEPVSSWRELLEEGVEMNHCIGGYGDIIARREVFAYRVMEPERLTLTIKKTGQGWVVDELRGRFNAMPSESAVEAVQAWLLII